MIVQHKKQKRLHRVLLKFPMGLSHSVFIRAYSRAEAERKALKQNPDAIGVEHSEYPLS